MAYASSTEDMTRWKTLEQALEASYNNDTLKQLGSMIDVTGFTRKAEICRALARMLLSTGIGSSRLAQIWNRLDEIQKAAVSEALFNDGEFDGDRFHAKCPRDPHRKYKSIINHLQRFPSVRPLHLRLHVSSHSSVPMRPSAQFTARTE